MNPEEIAAAAAAKALADKAAADKAEADRITAEKAAAELAAKGGRKFTDDEAAALLKENMQKKDAIRAKETELATAQALLKTFEGIDPVAVKALLAEKAAAEVTALEKAGDYDRLKTRMAEEHAKATKALETQLAELKAANAKAQGQVDELSVGSNFAQSKFIAEELTLPPSKARALYAGHFDVVDGKVVPFDLPRGAPNRTPLVNAAGQAVDFEAALRTIIEADPEKDHLLKSKVKPGASSNSKPGARIPAAQTGPQDGVSKIAAGLKALNLNVKQQ